MNNFKKIGLSALAGSLVAFSAHAGELSATGSASLTMADADTNGTAISGNQFTMGDSITLTGSGEMDNGMTISVSFEIDNDDVGGGNVYDSHSMTLDTNGMGTITFAGHGGDSAMSALDDVTPNAYEESWDAVTGADTGTRVAGSSGDNMFTYTSPSISGATVTMAYLNASDAVTDVSYSDFAIAYSPEMVDGLTVGYGQGDTEVTTGTEIEHTAMYVKYTYGSVTVGYQENEADGPATSDDIDFEAFGISYAVSDNLTIAYNQSESKVASDTVAQEATGISASFTSGGMTIAGVMNDVDNVSGVDTNDTEGYELNLSFAF
ncbi:porin [Candidatus Pelagibacter ubique]|nr:porin [Candidatus Pelagibacter ubique]